MVIRWCRVLCGLAAVAAPLAGCSTGSATDAGAGAAQHDAGRCDDQPAGKCTPGATCWQDCFGCTQGYGHIADFIHPGKTGNLVLTGTCQDGYYSLATIDCFGGISEGPYLDSRCTVLAPPPSDAGVDTGDAAGSDAGPTDAGGG